jgi:CII-binding regulator of phage lambda lysogenization HflD
LCKRVFKLASDLEKNKLLEEKRQLKETEFEKINQKEKMISTIENFYKDKINMLKERIDKEKFERKIAQEA